MVALELTHEGFYRAQVEPGFQPILFRWESKQAFESRRFAGINQLDLAISSAKELNRIADVARPVFIPPLPGSTAA